MFGFTLLMILEFVLHNLKINSTQKQQLGIAYDNNNRFGYY